jgi:hypothetical protein
MELEAVGLNCQWKTEMDLLSVSDKTTICQVVLELPMDLSRVSDKTTIG